MSPRPEYLDYRLDGLNLIEAAAGTGKTYTIQNLVVRFLLERRLPIGSLLVVTFTEAAAAELKERIRLVLTSMLKATEGDQIDSERESCLLENAVQAGTSRDECAKLLRMALLMFDEAPISTIHGFCAKILGENAFESGILFRSELVQDPSAIIAELGMDFYRKTFYRPDSELMLTLAEVAGITPDSLLDIARKKLNCPRLIVKAPEVAQNADSEELCRQAATLIAQLPECDLPDLLSEITPYLNKLGDIAATDAPEVAAKLFDAPLSAANLKQLFKFGRSFLTGKIKKRLNGEAQGVVEQVLSDPIFDLPDQLENIVYGFGVALKLEASGYIRREFDKRKTRDNFITFNDLLNLLHCALYAPQSRLSTVLRERYKVAIIDEFQDTDPVQYEIFTHLFRRPDSTLYMVGDPRQAIYSFRGGDIATYRRAVEELQDAGGHRYCLSTNFRSSAAMINAVNTIFHEHTMPFADQEIDFPQVSASESAPKLLRNEEESTHPLRVIHAPEANQEVCQNLVVWKVLELLNDRTIRLSERDEPGIRPGDIAILTLAGYEAQNIAEKLRFLHIPAVFTNVGNIFATEDAKELLTVLRVVASGNIRDLPGLLVTPLGGRSLEEIARLQEDAETAQLHLEQSNLRQLQQLWENGSFIEFFNALLAVYHIRSRYPALPHGERKLTNLLQLGDLLEQESARSGLTPAGIVDFLAERIADPGKVTNEEFQQLLETDREAVKLMTVHGSKGLEFPIVLLPGLHGDNAEKHAETFHNRAGQLEYDLSQTENLIAQHERLQELLRLAYVAMTRAKYGCFVYWGKSNKKTTALDWLFRMRDFNPDGEFGISLLAAADQDPDIPPELRDRPPATIQRDIYRAVPDAEIQLELLPGSPQIDHLWQFVSYSSLSPRSGVDTPFDYEQSEIENISPDTPTEGGIFSIRGGAATGNAWHRILELADFQSKNETELRRLIQWQLSDFGVANADEEEKQSLTLQMVRDVLTSPLEGADKIRFRLRDVPKNERLAELEFAYGFNAGFTTKQLQSILADFARTRFGLVEWPAWSRTVSGGCLNGFIDLLFRHHGKYFILDWKSNRLGGRSANFLPDRLKEEMTRNFYFLQYLIYTVATVKFLRLRLGKFGEKEYDSLFGGVFYLFIRGISPEYPGRGVFYDKAPYQLIRQLEEIIG
ncbi:MAG: UvrD-helicase domain-containing protein [Victivallales bacterium]|jgi:exodeoxyribonuclease V beta subunit|nr:UvrD-helicase domain-containing protein [Victivallales bacterium]